MDAHTLHFQIPLYSSLLSVATGIAYLPAEDGHEDCQMMRPIPGRTGDDASGRLKHLASHVKPTGYPGVRHMSWPTVVFRTLTAGKRSLKFTLLLDVLLVSAALARTMPARGRVRKRLPWPPRALAYHTALRERQRQPGYGWRGMASTSLPVVID